MGASVELYPQSPATITPALPPAKAKPIMAAAPSAAPKRVDAFDPNPKQGPRVKGPERDTDFSPPGIPTWVRIGGSGLAGVAMISAIFLPFGIGIALAIVALLAILVLNWPKPDAVDAAGKNNRVFTNFGREIEFKPEFYDRPSSEAEIAAILTKATSSGGKVKVIGSGHSFNGIFQTTQHLMSLEKINHMQVIDRDKGLVTVGAGTKLKDINTFLAANGLRMQNLGGIAEQAIAGAVTTGTHGSGGDHGIIATQVERMKLMTVDGTSRWLSKTEEPELFSAALVGLGALGVVTELTLRAVPASNLEELLTKTTVDDAFDQKKIDERLKKNDYFQVIWIPHSHKAVLVERNLTKKPAEAGWNAPEEADGSQTVEKLGLLLTKVQPLRPGFMHIATGVQADKTTIVGRSDAVLTRPLPPQQRETEYAFPVSRAAEVMREMRDAIEREGLKMNFPGAMRFIKGDNIMMSPANQGDSVYFSVLLQGATEEDDRVMHVIQRVMRDLGGRAHWGKEIDTTAEQARAQFGANYDRFVALMAKHDPNGVLRNAYLDRLFPKVGTPSE